MAAPNPMVGERAPAGVRVVTHPSARALTAPRPITFNYIT